MDHFVAKSSKSVLDDTVTERADIWGFGSTAGYDVTPHYRLQGSLHVIEIFKKLAAENRGEKSDYNDHTNLSNRFSIMRGPRELTISKKNADYGISKTHPKKIRAYGNLLCSSPFKSLVFSGLEGAEI